MVLNKNYIIFIVIFILTCILVYLSPKYKNYILFCSVFIMILISINVKNIKIEGMENVSYEALQNLASMYDSGKLKITNLEVTGDVDIKGNTNIEKDITAKGNINIDKNLSAKGTINSDVSGTFGNMFIGNGAHSAEFPFIANKNMLSNENIQKVALLQHNNGHTVLNGRVVHINTLNNNRTAYEDNRVWFKTPIVGGNYIENNAQWEHHKNIKHIKDTELLKDTPNGTSLFSTHLHKNPEDWGGYLLYNNIKVKDKILGIQYKFAENVHYNNDHHGYLQ